MVKPLGTIIAAVSMLSGVIAVSPHAAQLTPGTAHFYVSLGYGPVISNVSGFRIGTNEETKWVFPYHKRQGVSELHSENFFWSTATYPEFRFKKSSSGYQGALGYSHRGMRMELEVDHVKFDIVPTGQQKKLRAGGIPFALGKEVTVQSTRVPARLVEHFPKFSSRGVNTIIKYLRDPTLLGADKAAIFGHHARLLGHIAKHLAEKEEAITPGVKAARDELVRQDSEVFDTYIDSVEDPDGIITRSIAMGAEGAEIVELTSINNTSFTANLCYDFLPIKVTKFRLSPYTCAGIGSSIVGVAEGHINAQFSYKLKLGLDYSLTPKFTIYAGAVYSGIKGMEYDRIPVKRLVDDISHYSNSNNEATASFGYTAVSLEFGSRMLF
ncbi:major surface protein 2 [Anaplasma platys]|uniref:Major surface protein 2 n=1 Tax=Anaplasma platys TaxID=949 RepID=A0A858PZK3_9RICK|nr:P44/Msp2 family outer membrane protein [Anaplasma platys]QJC27958.1 major surface protein 2 [Anaplasma platys]